MVVGFDTGDFWLLQGIGDSKSRRDHVRAAVLEFVRTRGPISKSELARLGRLKFPTASALVDDLVAQGYVGGAGTGPSTGGRPPNLFELRPKARCAVGVNVGTRNLTAVITDLDGTIERRIEMASEMSGGPEALSVRVKQALGRLLDEIPRSLGEVLGIGLAVPAPVSGPMGTLFSPPSYRPWGELNIGRLVEKEFGFPVLIDNDANAAAIGEYLYGAAREARNVFYLIAHRGVGGAAVVEGRLYRGDRGGAGEVGHTVIDLEGPRCGCGRDGCLEAFAGRAAVARRASRALRLSGGGTMNGRGPDLLEAEDVIRAGLAGDETARKVLEETGQYLGLGISNIVNMFDPGLVVMGGSTMQAGHLVLDPAIEVVRKRALPTAAEEVRVVIGKLGENAGAVGAASLVLRSLFAAFLSERREAVPMDGTATS